MLKIDDLALTVSKTFIDVCLDAGYCLLEVRVLMHGVTELLVIDCDLQRPQLRFNLLSLVLLIANLGDHFCKGVAGFVSGNCRGA